MIKGLAEDIMNNETGIDAAIVAALRSFNIHSESVTGIAHKLAVSSIETSVLEDFKSGLGKGLRHKIPDKIGIDIAKSFVQINNHEKAFTADTQVIKYVDELMGSILNLKA